MGVGDFLIGVVVGVLVVLVASMNEVDSSLVVN